MTKTKAPAQNAAKKKPSIRTLRRQFLAAQKVKSPEPLRGDEYADLVTKMERAANTQRVLIEESQGVDVLRAELLQTETALKDAEEELRAATEEHQTALREVAPLLDRLPTV